MKNTYLFSGVILVVLLFGGYALFSRQSTTPEPQTPVTESNETQRNEVSGTVPSSESEVHLTERGFIPASLTVKQGTTVTFINDTKESMWVGSDEHPSHTGYAGTSKKEHCPDTAGVAFDQCSVGNTYTFTFTNIGTWGYHNHMNAGFKGSITVTP